MKNRYSKQREQIMDVLNKCTSHPGVDEIFQTVRKINPKISLGTVYRNLEQLTNQNMIRRIDIPGKPTRYDANISEHNHIYCERCGKIMDIFLNSNKIDDYIYHDIELNNFTVTKYKINIFGICNDCTKRI